MPQEPSLHIARDSSPAVFTAADVAAILRERGWLVPGDGREPAAALGIESWTAEAAALLGRHSASREVLSDLLSLVFHYDAGSLLSRPENHAVMARVGAREVIRSLASRVLDGPPVDSDRYKEIIAAMKDELPYRGCQLFYPIRLALAGRAGEGELDRVILLLDSASALPFAGAIKRARQRMLEFCAQME